MADTYKILHLEDVSTDAELVARELKKSSISFEHLVVDREEDYREALDQFCPDIVLCDHSLPSFNSLEAIRIIKAKKLCIPFVLITATLTEELAVSVVKAGADDYIFKDRLQRLPNALINAIEKYRFEKERTQLIEQAHEKEALSKDLLGQLSNKLLLATSVAGIGIWEYLIHDNKFVGDDVLFSLYGITSADFDGSYKMWIQFIHPEDKNRVNQEFQDAVSKYGDFDTEFRIIWNDGSIHFIKAVALVQRDADGNPTCIIGTNQDITLTKEAEKTIKESEEKYRSFFENSMDGILLTVTDGSIIAANPAACNILQMTEDEICKAGRFGLVDMTDPRLQPLLEERRRTGKAKGEITWIRKDGSRFPGEVTSAVFTDAYGNPRTSMIIRDVTERKQAEQKLISTSNALRKALNDVEKIMDSSLDIICSIDEEGKFLNVSSASEHVWGYKPNELTGKRYMDMVFAEDAAHTIDVAEGIMSGVPVTMFENRYVRKDGSVVPLLWSAKWDDNDKLMYCIAKDATEKKRLEAAFDREKQRLHDLFLHAPASVGVFKGPEHVFEMANDVYLQLTGRKKIIGKTVREVFPEIENQGFFEILDRVYSAGIPFTANERLVQIDKKGDGSLEDKYLNFVYHPYRDAANAVEGIFFFIVDVTEQVETRKKIKKSEKRFRQLIQDLPEAVYTCNPEGKIELYNRAAVKLWGRKPVIGQEYWSGAYKKYHINGTPISNEETSMALAIKSGKARFELEIIIEKPNGIKRFAQANAIPLFDGDKKLIGGVNMLVDITRLKLAEEKLRTSNERYEIVTNVTNDAIWDWNLLTNEIYWNKSYERLFGFKNLNQKLDAHQWFGKVHADDRERVINGVMNLIDNGGTLWEDEYKYIKIDGEQAIVYDRGYLMYDKQGKPVRFVGAMQDITQRKKIENEREYLIEHLVKSNNDLKQFSYITSHNFRAPLTNLIGLLGLVDRSTLSEANTEIVNMFETSTHQLNKTINDLIQILIIKNNLNVNIVTNDLNAVLDDVCSSLSYEISETGCTINRSIAVEHLVLNKSYLESILINLISNSIKYRSPNRKLIIDILIEKKAGEEIVLVIRDNGSGIDMNRYKDRIFGLYQRFHSNKDGVGLGLYMVKTQIMALGGSIEVESEVDKGTRFCITFKDKVSLALSA